MDQLQKNVQKILQFLKRDGDVLDAKLEGEVQHQVSGSFQVYRNSSCCLLKNSSLFLIRAANCTETLLSSLHPTLCSKPFLKTAFVTIAYLFPYSL